MQHGPATRLDYAENGLLKARITPTHLVVFRPQGEPEEIPLEAITHVADFQMANGMIGVNVFTNRGADTPDPGLGFRTPKVADSFVETLEAEAGPRNEYGLKGSLRPYHVRVVGTDGSTLHSTVRLHAGPHDAGRSVSEIARRECPGARSATARQLSVKEWLRHKDGGNL